ncbi:MAG: glycosyltransferase, partial [Caldilineae bacterium]
MPIWDFPVLLVHLFTWQGHQVGVLTYLVLIFVNTWMNWRGLRSLHGYGSPAEYPPVAVLIPARNEEAAIERCVRSLLAQDYPVFRIWVLDDHSTDATRIILDRLAGEDSRLQVLAGAPLPDGWLGKPWACQQLAQAVPADVPLLLFVDADTWHHPHMLANAVAGLEAEGADLLSTLPRQITVGVAEMLSVPIIPWSLWTHFPLALAQRWNWPLFAAAIGQMILVRREAYRAVGGHGAVRREVAEDMALARLASRAGRRWRMSVGAGRVFCRMYRSPGQVWEGFGKNLFAVFGRNLLFYLFVWLWLGVVFLGPWITLAGGVLGGWPVDLSLAASAIVLAAATWALTIHRLALSPRIFWL